MTRRLELLILQRGAELEAGALTAKAFTALKAAPAGRPIGRFVFFSLCVDGGAAEKQLDFPLHRPPPLVLRSPRWISEISLSLRSRTESSQHNCASAQQESAQSWRRSRQVRLRKKIPKRSSQIGETRTEIWSKDDLWAVKVYRILIHRYLLPGEQGWSSRRRFTESSL